MKHEGHKLIQQSGYKFDTDKLAHMVREKRGERNLRELARELSISASTLSRVENSKPPDWHSLTILCTWLNTHPGEFFQATSSAVNGTDEQDNLIIQLRADRNLSPETSSALLKVVRTLYEQMYAQIQEDGRA